MSTFKRLAGSLTCPRAQRFRLKGLLILLLFASYGSGFAYQTERTDKAEQTDKTEQAIIFAARVSLVEGEVNYRRANDPDKDWFDATLNLPLHEKDQIYSGPDGRAELQLSGRNIIRINHDTNLRFSQFDSAAAQLALPIGTATFRIDSMDRRQFQNTDAQESAGDERLNFEIDSPVVAITFLKEGNYRVDVTDDGTTEVEVLRGQAEVYNQDLGTISVKEGRRFIVKGEDKDEFQV
ncbi:MAG: FecR domain-containing protein, partial [Blastocatellia bacterium]|nr:FecR domain-containing protein [Blastocatellia bacterium]